MPLFHCIDNTQYNFAILERASTLRCSAAQPLEASDARNCFALALLFFSTKPAHSESLSTMNKLVQILRVHTGTYEGSLTFQFPTTSAKPFIVIRFVPDGNPRLVIKRRERYSNASPNKNGKFNLLDFFVQVTYIDNDADGTIDKFIETFKTPAAKKRWYATNEKDNEQMTYDQLLKQLVEHLTRTAPI